MRKPILAALVLTAVVGAALLAYFILRPPETPSSRSALRVAAVLSLTGSAAQFDSVKRQTLEVARERISALYPGVPLEIEVYDAGAGADTALLVARRAVEDGADIILSGTSPNALAIASVVRGRADIVHLANAANPDFGPPRPFEYRLWPDWNDEAREIASLARREGWGRVLLVNSSDPYSTALRNALQGELGQAVTFRHVTFDPASAPDFRPNLLRAKTEGTDAVIVFGLPPGIRSLIGQLAEVRWNAAVVGGVNINLVQDDFRRSGLAVPLWSVRTTAMRDDLPPTSEPRRYRDQFTRRYGEAPPFHALYFADGAYLGASGSSRGAQPDFDPRSLLSVTTFESASGPIRVSNGVLRYEVWSERIF
jgi:ABC-type branched-subunit amino acid transport system substrate-binding protein